MKRLLVFCFVVTVLVAAGVVVFHRPSREQSKRALKKMTPQPLARAVKDLERGKLPIGTKSRATGTRDPNAAQNLLEQSLRLFKDLVSAVPEPRSRAAARRVSRKPGPPPAPADPLEDAGTSLLSRLLDPGSTNLGTVLREILETGFSTESLEANRDLFEDLFPTPVPPKSRKARSRR